MGEPARASGLAASMGRVAGPLREARQRLEAWERDWIRARTTEPKGARA